MNKIIIGIPGPWSSREALVSAVIGLAGSQPRWLLAGNILMDLNDRQQVLVEFDGRNDGMQQAFEIAGGGRLSADTLQSIGGHEMTAYVLADCGLAGARRVVDAAAALLDAGGLGVKVETAGLAFDPEHWRALASSGSTLSLYDALVTLVGGDGGATSCGMHNFGLPDATISGIPAEQLANQLTAFNQWQLLTRPDLKDGSLFADSLTSQALEMHLVPYGYETDSTLNNPHGRWEMKPSARSLDLEPASDADGPLFMTLDSSSFEAVQAVETARATVDRLVDFIASSAEFGRPMLKLRIVDGEESALMWLGLVRIDDETITGHLFEVPPAFRAHKPGQEVTVARTEIEDWAIFRCGAVIGGFSLRLQHHGVADRHKQWWTMYTGNLAFEPLGDVVDKYLVE